MKKKTWDQWLAMSVAVAAGIFLAIYLLRGGSR